MNNEETKPSKDMMDMIKEHTDKTCDMVIDNCIEVVKDVTRLVSTFEGHAMGNKIIERLQNLKNKSNG